MATIYKCDKCGRDIENYFDRVRITVEGYVNSSVIPPVAHSGLWIPEVNNFDFCRKCANELKGIINLWTKE